MSTLINIVVYHDGQFAPHPNCDYIGGKSGIVENVDIDLLSFWDLEDWAAMFGYSPQSLLYFKNNGHDFSSGMRLVYDDSSIRYMVEVCKPYGKIDVYVDSSLTDEAIEAEKNGNNAYMDYGENMDDEGGERGDIDDEGDERGDIDGGGYENIDDEVVRI